MSGASGFNEVYFTDLRVKDSQRIGAVGDGWRVSLVTLMNERNSIGGGARRRPELIELASRFACLTGARHRRPATRSCAGVVDSARRGPEIHRLAHDGAVARPTPGPENSIGKLVTAPLMQDVANTAIELEDQFGIIPAPTSAPPALLPDALDERAGMRIAGGTDEIMRNIIAERVLGLPQDMRVDKDVAFTEIPAKGR